MFENRMAHVLSGDYTPLSAVDIFVKDLGLVLDTARATKFPLPLASTAHQMFMQASTAGFAKEDDAAVIKIFPGSSCRAQMTIRLGCIADDFTGATDLANNLVRAGMRAVQTIGVPADDAAATIDADAVVVALKSRTDRAAARGRAVARGLPLAAPSRRDADLLQGLLDLRLDAARQHRPGARGADGRARLRLHDRDAGVSRQRAHGLQGPSLRRRRAALRERHARPSADADDRRQPRPRPAGAARAGAATVAPARRVGLVDHRATGASAAAIRARFDALRSEGVAIAIADAIDNDDLHRLGEAVRDLPLVCAGSGLAIGLPRNFAIAASGEAASLPAVKGFNAIVSGSCSQATNAQVAEFLRSGGAARRVDPLELADDDETKARGDIAAWAEREWSAAPERPVLVYSTAPPQAVAAAQARSGAHDVGARVERLLAAIAAALVEGGARRLVVAGGETSGACVQALGVERLRIGRQIDPGVPWCHAAPALAPDGLQIALKSGNFGGVDFFTRAFAVAT
jgi:uncharacterized protein YgbK (DUF1537 family)